MVLAFRLAVLALLLAGAGCGQGGSEDILNPDERRWLADNQGRILLAVETGYAPFVFLDADGQPTGLAHDHLLLLEAKLATRFGRRHYDTLDEILAKARRGEIQVVNAVTPTSGRAEFLAFTKPFLSVPNVIIVRKERPGLLHEDDLRGLRVALVRSYAVTEHLARTDLGITTDLVSDDLTGLLNVSFGRADAVVIDLATASHLIQKKGITNLRVAGEASLDVQLSMATPKAEGRLQDILQKGLASITEDERQAIRTRWINASDKSLFSDRRFWLATGALLVIVAAILTWNRTLRQQVVLRTRSLAEERESLRESREKYRSILNASPDAIIFTDLEGRTLMVSPAGLAMLGCATVDAVLGRLMTDFIAPGDHERAASNVALMFQGLMTGVSEYRGLRPDGSSFDMEANGEFIRDAEGQPTGMVFIVRDITDRKRAEAERQLFEKYLQQTQKLESLGSLAGGVAHDMNNVLGAILGLASASIGGQPEGSQTRQAFATIIKAAERGGKMVKSLLGFARQSPAEECELDLNAIIREEVRLLERTTLAKVRLEMDLAANLRPMLGDASALTHALMNLCVNAVDAMPEQGMLTLRTRNLDNGWIEAQVEDTGTGMAKEVLEKAMDPFFTTKEHGKGTGLGLSLVYSTVNAHRGQLELRSEPGRGTCVSLRFPACATKALATASIPGPGPGASGAALGVLLVDDDDLILCSVAQILEHLGHAVTAASSGEEALAALTAGLPYDLVILDMNMPGLGGASTLSRLRALRPAIPVLLSTGRSDQAALDLVEAHPGVTLLAKPFSMGDLERALQGLGSAQNVAAEPPLGRSQS